MTANTSRTTTALAAHLQNLHSLAWGLFLGASTLLLAVASLDIGEAQIAALVGNAELRAALALMLKALDATWITLAAVNVYVFVAQAEGIATARRWAGIVVIASGVLAWLSAATGLPFGRIHFTDNLGTRIAGVVPFTVPLLWFGIVVSSRYVALRMFPRVSHWQLAAIVAALVLLTDVNLECFARLRYYWLWQPIQFNAPTWPPLHSYAAWFVAALLIAGCLRESRMMVLPPSKTTRPIVIFSVLNIVMLVANLSRLA